MENVSDQARLRSDPFYLRCQLCERFRKYDTYNRGLITAASFSRSLEDLGLRFGHDEVSDILRFCTITDDGYVHYKELIKHTSPEEPKAKKNTPYAIYPAPDSEDNAKESEPECGEALNENNPAAKREFIAGKTHDIQKLYSRWDRGLLATPEFVKGLEELHIPISEEFRRLIQIHGPARDLGFAQLMASLQINDFIQRKARHPIVAQDASTQRATVSPRTFGGRKPSIRNPVTWVQGDDHLVSYFPSDQEGTSDKRDKTQRVICDFCDGITDSTVFAAKMEALGVLVTPDIQRLIRMHESGNCVHFREFASIVMRQGESAPDKNVDQQLTWKPAIVGDSQRQSEAPSYLITPYATELTPAPSILRTTAQMDAMSPNAPNLPHFRRGEMERPSGRQQVDRTTCMGDIIGWTGLPAEKQDGPVPPNFWRNNGDIITWGVNHATENLASESSPKGRHGRKYYEISRRAEAPFGTDRDVGQPIDKFAASTDVYRQSHQNTHINNT
eukprot:GEMP01022285.1.p1 GENE.GEMP01022285.1~~GEMP01022285.1.p1  ORF type:complete len:502 (+),score=85.08 GEMP01022285.1:63-1568(+)